MTTPRRRGDPAVLPTPRLRQAVVTAAAAGPPRTVTIQLGGDPTSIDNVRYLDSYAPMPTETVWVMQNGPDLLVLGRLAAGWRAWTPTYSGLTLGNGTVEDASYTVVGGVVHWRLRIVLGSTSSVTALVVVSLPVNPPTPDDVPLGSGYVNDASATANRTLISCIRNSGGTGFHMLIPGGTVASGSPFAWAADDSINAFGSYPA